ncbi:hypothetical protein F5B20DRAFT_249296 [Whalleya microplaca]|nr:hypothetical protein F5B20DRAFT_249296 [Whalleya microplaca]
MQRPASPWARRFGTYSHYSTTDGTDHSSVAPVYPLLNPKYYADNTTLSFHVGLPFMPSNGELDAIFYTERNQQYVFLHGLKTWQVGALNGTLEVPGPQPTLPSGHTTISRKEEQEFLAEFYSRLAPVEEERWFPVFRKVMWLGIAESTGGLTGPDGWHDGPDGEWGVDNPAIWGHLRHSIDRADRILKALMDENNEW